MPRPDRRAHGDTSANETLIHGRAAACVLHDSPRMESTSENRIIARRYLSELWSRGILETADELAAPHCQLSDPFCGGGTGPDAIKAAVQELRVPFPDLAFSLDSFIVETGHQLALRWFAHGTHRGPLLGIEPTEREFLVSGLLLLRIENGKLIAITACWEPTLLLEQLGLLDSSFDPAPCEPLPVPAPALETPVPVAVSQPAPIPVTLPFAPMQTESELDAGWT